MTMTGSNEKVQVNTVLDYYTFQFVFVYFEADWVNWRSING